MPMYIIGLATTRKKFLVQQMKKLRKLTGFKIPVCKKILRLIYQSQDIRKTIDYLSDIGCRYLYNGIGYKITTPKGKVFYILYDVMGGFRGFSSNSDDEPLYPSLCKEVYGLELD